ncbi:conserved hypothetical protein [Roseibium sp. TrichSKD4]|uniref:hypothetical protein n=1 Tax=Roseibium sp. TrichSKD4 TaxID=744980 RepID=UPI0001E56930|nr:hypothetical protein [Roseibium sp. TrichSKD4]EFO32464.1 conserved hypothetical protein [Roseibium sp. TrichSKD4]
MAKARRDTLTGDLLSWEPPKVEARYEETRVRAATLRGKVCRVVTEAMDKDGRSRDEIAGELSAYLREPISADTTYQWTSEANENRNIPGYALIGLAEILNAPEILNELLANSGFVVVDRKYIPLIEREIAIEQRERMDRFIAASDAEWKTRK